MQKPWKRVRRFLKTLKIELPCYPAIPLLGMRVELLQSLLTLGNPMDWSPQGSVHGIPRQEYQTGLSYLPPRIFPTQGSNLQLLHCKQILYRWATGKAQTPRHISRQNYNSKRHMQPTVHAALFTITRTWKQVKYPLTDEWIIHTHIRTDTQSGILLNHKRMK